ncbi:MAG: class F sortase [Ornithinibacter sp.]
MTPRDQAKSWNAVAAGAAIVAVAALVGLIGWGLTRPSDSAGDGISSLAATSASPTPAPPAAASRTLPRPAVRDASVGSLDLVSAPSPTRVVIEDLDVDASVDAVGVQDDGAMVIPAARTSVGWYRFGSAPQDPEGNTVIAGHVATPDGPGALAPLSGAEPGMVVSVTDADGEVHRYEITGREKIVKKALPVDDIFARDEAPHLVLITCGGEYIPELRSHRDNIVVTARPIS